MGRNDVEKVFDDAEAEIDFLLIDRNLNPRLHHSTLSQYSQCKRSVPNASMMTAIVSGNSDNRHPRLEYRLAQRELLCYLLSDLIALDVVENLGQNP